MASRLEEIKDTLATQFAGLSSREQRLVLITVIVVSSSYSAGAFYGSKAHYKRKKKTDKSTKRTTRADFISRVKHPCFKKKQKEQANKLQGKNISLFHSYKPVLLSWDSLLKI